MEGILNRQSNQQYFIFFVHLTIKCCACWEYKYARTHTRKALGGVVCTLGDTGNYSILSYYIRQCISYHIQQCTTMLYIILNTAIMERNYLNIN